MKHNAGGVSTPTPAAGSGAAFPVVIAEWHKAAGHVVRVALDEFKGRVYVGARVWYTAASGEMRPSKNGVGLSLRHLPDLIRALQEAQDRAKQIGVMDDTGGAQ